MTDIVGRWVQKEGQPYAGLWFDFKSDGTFTAEYEAMAIHSSGKYDIEDNQITMQQTEHTFGLVGEFKGLFAIEGDTLSMALAAGAGQDRPKDLSEARTYQRD